MSTYVPIQSVTLNSTASSVAFSNIPQNFTDLVLVCNGALSSGNQSIYMRINGDSASNYSYTRLTGNGTTAASSRVANTTQAFIAAQFGMTATYETIIISNIQSYSNTTTNKTIISRASTASLGTEATVNLWRSSSTAAITSLSVFPSSGTFASDCTFNLFGIGRGTPKAFGGDSVTTDGTYWYHIYNSSGTFQPMQSLSVDYVVVGGGGSGGSNGGGGGGGGYQSGTLTVSELSTVVVGAGGASRTAGYTGFVGSSSVFATITANGGGGGGGAGSVSPNALNGGCGGGAGFSGNANYTGGSGSQGGNGGNSTTSGTANNGGGGGGGANANGSAGTTTGSTGTGGAGGAGIASSISGTSVTRGGGGGGGATNTAGTGGAGGGGNGAQGTGGQAGTAGTANTGGGGGGGAGGNGTGGAGGSGVVIVRYLV